MTSNRALWLDACFGASGDMMLGTLIGLGASIDAVRSDLATLGLDGWTIEARSVQRADISATRVEVAVEEQHHHRSWTTIDRLLAESGLPEEVSAGARSTFRALGEAEAGIHDVTIDEVHFHEVGALDAIVDIVGAWSALHHLAVDTVHGGPIGLGGGTVNAAHGVLPIPAPATLALLIGTPVEGIDASGETVTPTGAALLSTMVERWGPLPAGRLIGAARGAGGRNPSTHPNVLTGALIEQAASPTETENKTGNQTENTVDAVVIATNLDDATPEIIGHTLTRLLAAGADDAWVAPIGMKKNRPGHELRVLCRPDLAPAIREIVFSETGTLGLRVEPVTKHVLEREFRVAEVRGHQVRIKVGPHGAKPEYDDLVAVAEATGIAVKALLHEVLLADSRPCM